MSILAVALCRSSSREKHERCWPGANPASCCLSPALPAPAIRGFCPRPFRQGSIQRYFACVAGGSGSFLKPGKFSTGVSMAEALRDQYVGMDAPLVAPENVLPDAYASTAKGGKKVRASFRRDPVAQGGGFWWLRAVGVFAAGAANQRPPGSSCG